MHTQEYGNGGQYFCNPNQSLIMLIPDSYRYQGLRKRMVDELREKGMLNESILDALRAVPRHQFFQDIVFLTGIHDRKIIIQQRGEILF